jgi:hypothetical protein
VDHGKVLIEDGDPTVSDAELIASIKVLALTIYDYVNREPEAI